MQISIVIPLLDEAASLTELNDWIVKIMRSNHFSYEIIYIDDGSTDDSWEVIKRLRASHNEIKGIRFLKNFGKSQALNAGFKIAQGDVIITMDADLQDSPDEIPELFAMVQHQGFDLVSGWKKKRFDNIWAKNLPSKLFNWAARFSSGLKLHDFNCGLKAYKKEVIKSIDVYGDMHRYIPVLAKNEGFVKIEEKIVQHQARKYGITKFGMERFRNGFFDLLTIWFLSKFGKRPMHFFGTLGLLMMFIGFGFAMYLGIDKLYFNPKGRLIADRTEFYIALTTVIMGTQLFVAGFIGELILKTKTAAKRYEVLEEIV
jgi:glycosyltransferase involved in cell wall biosynthesis